MLEYLRLLTDAVAAGGVTRRGLVSRVAIYVVAVSAGERARIESRRQALVSAGDAVGFDPGHRPEDLAVLRELFTAKSK